MKILLLGEYSNLHWTIAEGLRRLGHHVTVVSDGDTFKDCPRDINLKREGYSLLPTIKYVYSIVKNFRHFKGFDIVQIINPCFLDLKPDRNLQVFNYLKKYNSKIYLGAFGNDYYWVKACNEKKIFRYSEFDIPNRKKLSTDVSHLLEFWYRPKEAFLNTSIAEKSDGIIACLYEYYESYKAHFGDKLVYIPEPVNLDLHKFTERGKNPDCVNFFIGIQTKRSSIKGTDIMLEALRAIHHKYPKETSLKIAESVPYATYIQLMNQADVILDQLYSYSPAMNALAAMAQGLIAVSGGEPEMYELLNEYDNRPVVNVLPSEESVYNALESLVANKSAIADLSQKSRLFIEKHHDQIKVAQQYLDFWSR